MDAHWLLEEAFLQSPGTASRTFGLWFPDLEPIICSGSDTNEFARKSRLPASLTRSGLPQILGVVSGSRLTVTSWLVIGTAHSPVGGGSNQRLRNPPADNCGS